MSSSAFGRRCLLTGILLLAAFLRFWNLIQNGFGNLYYAAAVRSMRGSFSRFLFAAYDPAGFISVDKPPVALQVQTLFTFLFGYRGIALLLPQAIAGTLAVFLLYRLVRRDFGTLAGLASALFLALSPMTVAADRMNLPDSLLTLTLLGAAGALLSAIREGSNRALLLCALLLGLGFEIKMWEALVPVPVFAALYLRFAPFPLKQKCLLLAVAGIVLLAVAFSWVLLVDTVPPGQRPYVGGSRNNSAFDLIFVYNGWERWSGGKDQLGTALLGPGGALAGLGATPGFWAGPPGPLRLFSKALGPQVLWFFGLALAGFAAIPGSSGSRERQTALGLWGGWFLIFAIVFSFAGGTLHPYYLTVMSPALAALAGIGLATAYRAQKTRLWPLPTALGLAALFQGLLLRDYAAVFPILLIAPGAALLVAPATLWKKAGSASLALALLLLSLPALLGMDRCQCSGERVDPLSRTGSRRRSLAVPAARSARRHRRGTDRFPEGQSWQGALSARDRWGL